MRRLGAQEGDGGYCHFPAHYGVEYFNQMTAEQLVTRYHKGFKKQEFVAIRKRNEVFDCRVYATAALELTGVDVNAHRRALEIKLQEAKEAKEAEEPAKSRKGPQRRRTSFVDSWRE